MAKTTYDTVHALLKSKEVYRNSDTKLLWRVWADLGYAVKDEEWSITFDMYCKASAAKVSPGSVLRARRKVQENFPELEATDPEARKARKQKESMGGNFVYNDEVTPLFEAMSLEPVRVPQMGEK